MTASLRAQLLGDDEVQQQLYILHREKKTLENQCAVLESNYLIADRTITDINRKLEEKTFQLSAMTKDHERKIGDKQFEIDGLSRELNGLKSHLDNGPNLRIQIDTLNQQMVDLSIAAQSAHAEKSNIISHYESIIQKVAVVNLDDQYTRNELNLKGQLVRNRPSMPRNVDPETWNIFYESDPHYSEKLDAGQLHVALGKGIIQVIKANGLLPSA